MATHRIGETGLYESGPSNHHHHLSYAVLHSLNPTNTSFNNQEGSAFDFGELEEAIALQGVTTHHDEAKPPLYTAKPAATLEMFPSWPMRFQRTSGSSKSGGESTDSGSAANTLSSQVEAHLEPESPISRKASSDHQALDQKHFHQPQTPPTTAAPRRDGQ
ncbi:unnamed protein product [Ilex paraguariensis]|uniref:Uncharacterized protein n=1 Tax=Ilex paraguariensis TaxID=185542 RepID=A0ABC8U7B9_9AQUA